MGREPDHRSRLGLRDTVAERTTRYVHLIHLPNDWRAPQVRNAIIAKTAHVPPQLRRTLTWNQGRELTLHEDIEALTGFRIHFCDPHSPWRGTNENTNGLLRQYFPKGRQPVRPHGTSPLRSRAAAQPVPPTRPWRQDPSRGHARMPQRPIEQVIRTH
ncbi:IS30 family transposase [Streptomyces bauhiniae]|uniref:IS30 family transposase n=1 Tax=Streptomyces bauhiniae TaxID=2340725 RepID=UPI003630E9DA